MYKVVKAITPQIPHYSNDIIVVFPWQVEFMIMIKTEKSMTYQF